MPGVMLDIGAGSTKFVRRFRRFNPGFDLMYLCGEPEWVGVWDGTIHPQRIKKIQARYRQLNVATASLHFLTLNAPHPLIGSGGIAQEAARTLIPSGGVFISAHPIGNHPELPSEYFYGIGFRDSESQTEPRCHAWFNDRHGWLGAPVSRFTVDRYPEIVYPASATIVSRLRELRQPEELRIRHSSYVYANTDAAPSIKIWLRNERPFTEAM